MSKPTLACSQCSSPLPEDVLQARGLVTCLVCGAQLGLEVFPALFRPQARGAAAERILVEGEASCFYHPEKRAVIPCDACGRFLCSLCDLELNHQHLCPGCLQSQQHSEQLPELVNRRILHDSAALLLTIASSLLFCLWFLWIITAPVAIFLAVLSWKRPGSLLRKNHWRAVAAIFLALLQLAGFAGMIASFGGNLFKTVFR